MKTFDNMRSDRSDPPAGEPVIGQGLMLVMAIACGAMAANLYYAQPLIGVIGRDLGIASDRLGFIVMLTQFGYCAGLLGLVPLADRFENRRLILILTAGAAIGLTLVAVSQNMFLFLAASMMVGICSVGAQVLVPLAAHLATPERQGRVIGFIMAGLLTGIMLARPLSSALTEYLGWRAAFFVPALFMLLLWLVLSRTLPRRQPDGTQNPVQVIRSMVALFRTFPALRHRSFYQACLFAAFNLFWTASPLVLQSRFNLTQGGLALFALAGAGGALAAPLAGRFADRGWTRGGSIAAMLMAGLCFAATGPAVATLSLGMLVLLAITIDASTQMNQVLGQNIIYRLAPQSRGRINAIYMSIIFIGGGMGSLVAPLLYDRFGWAGCAIAGTLLALVPLAAMLVTIDKDGHST